MSCFPCFSSQGKKATKRIHSKRNHAPLPSLPQSYENHNHITDNHRPRNSTQNANGKGVKDNLGTNNIEAQTFTFRQLASATRNFRAECLVGEGGFGRVYRGQLNGQTVAVKQLDRNGLQGNREFLVEVLMLSLLHHPNLVNLIGYCADGDQRLLVYEFMPMGSLEDHLLEIRPNQRPLDWFTRMKIALGAAKGLEYLHDKANPPVIYRDLKSSNILLGRDFHAKLSDFGLAKLGPTGESEKQHVSTRVMGTYGYCSPEYQRTGKLTIKSDVYSFGVVLLEMITGQRVVDPRRPNRDQNLVHLAQPVFREPRRFPELADPLLRGDFPTKGLNQAVAIAAMCVQEEETARPLMSDVVTALSFLTINPRDDDSSPLHSDSSPISEHSDANSNDYETANERQRAVAEAVEWGNNHNSRSQASSYASFE